MLHDLTPYADWDYFLSRLESLRVYFWKYHQMPAWNFLLCGGGPELSNPQSWSYTWLGWLSVYFEPLLFAGLLLVGMTLLGFLSTALLLRGFGVTRIAASSGAAFFVLSGYFASHFNQGHLTFATFHLVPLLMLVASKYYQRELRGNQVFWSVAALVLVSFLFFQVALPHCLFYFFPALPVLALFLWIQHRKEPRAAVALAWSLAWVLSGAGVALFKLWPVVAWELDYPRWRVSLESVELLDYLRDSLYWDPGPFDGPKPLFQGSPYYFWEFHNYLGMGPYTVIGLAMLILGVRSWSQAKNTRASLLLVIFPLVLLVLGYGLGLGNHHPWGLGQIFGFFPILNSIRVFGRYQILANFGVAILSAWAIDRLMAQCHRSWAAVAGGALSLILVAPVFQNFVESMAHIRFQSQAEQRLQYPAKPPAGTYVRCRPTERINQTGLLRAGYWIADCYEPMTIWRVPRGQFESDSRPFAMATPAPNSLALTSDSLVLDYGTHAPTEVRLRVNMYPGFGANVAYHQENGGDLVLENPQRRAQLVVRAYMPAWQDGFRASIAALFIVAVLIGLRFLRLDTRLPRWAE